MLDLKQRLISEIHKINNVEILNGLSELLIEHDDAAEIEFSKDQIRTITQSQIQIEQGESFDHSEVMKLADG